MGVEHRDALGPVVVHPVIEVQFVDRPIACPAIDLAVGIGVGRDRVGGNSDPQAGALDQPQGVGGPLRRCGPGMQSPRGGDARLTILRDSDAASPYKCHGSCVRWSCRQESSIV